MSSKPKNNIRLSAQPRSLFPRAGNLMSASGTWNQGDLLVLDTTNHIINVASQESDFSTFLGVAPDTIVAGKLKRPYSTDVDSSQGSSEVAGPQTGVVCSLKLKTGDSFNPGDLIYGYPTGDAQTVSITGTKAIGIFVGAAVSTAPSGTSGEVLLGSRYPGDSLNMA